jgi:DNA polymerase-4
LALAAGDGDVVARMSPGRAPAWLCRDCFAEPEVPAADGRCAACGSPRLIGHAELRELAIAHIDCDAFYAHVEKRDRPELKDKPVIVGGGRRGVVSACCYVARIYGVRSAMPMFKALKACPDAVVIPPDMEKYQTVGREVRQRMLETTPLVETLSIDEAFLDLSGTQQLHGGAPAKTLARLARRIEDDIRITVSIGLSYNKFLAKIAFDLDKPRGFGVVGRGEAVEFLANQSVGLIWGVGKAARARLAADGIVTIGQVQRMDSGALIRRYGAIGERLATLSHGIDDRRVEPEQEPKSISAETTFDEDIGEIDALSRILWGLAETVSRRLKHSGLAGGTVALKLKDTRFRIRTRHRRLDQPTQLAETLYREALALLKDEADGTKFRLIGVGAEALGPADGADQPDLMDPSLSHRAAFERAIDAVRDKLGDDAIGKGRGLDRSGHS